MEPEVEWTVEQTKQLIALYRSKPQLWDPKHLDHKKKHKRHAALLAVSEKLGVSKLEVDRKIKNLVGQFSREINKFKKRNISPYDTKQSSWYAYKLLSFLLERIKRQPSLKTAEEIVVVKTENSEVMRAVSVQVPTSPAITTISASSSCQENQPDHQRTENLQAATIVPNSATSLQRFFPNSDECQVFGEYVACELRSLKSDDLRRKLKRNIQRQILETLEEDDVMLGMVF